MSQPHTELMTIMFVDIVGYTNTTNRLSRQRFSELHDVFDAIVERVCAGYHGHIVKKIGDAFLISFKTATDAVHCGIDLQKNFHKYNRTQKPPIPLLIRVVAHTGEVLIRKNDIYGDTVNTSARLESVAKAGDVIFSESTYLAMNKSEIPYKYIGAKRFKGLKNPIKLFKVLKNVKPSKYLAQNRLHRPKKKRRSSVDYMLVTALLLLVIVALATLGALYWSLL